MLVRDEWAIKKVFANLVLVAGLHNWDTSVAEVGSRRDLMEQPGQGYMSNGIDTTHTAPSGPQSPRSPRSPREPYNNEVNGHSRNEGWSPDRAVNGSASTSPHGSNAYGSERRPDGNQPTQLLSRRQSGSKRICGKCKKDLTGQFVRALDNTFHLECFTCHVSLMFGWHIYARQY